MNEDILQILFLQGLYNNIKFISDTKENIEILSTGTKNNDSGPDFINARVKIDKTLWAGNIELHLKASDWYLHNHHHDKAYNNVILHVVTEIDKPTVLQNKQIIPAIKVDIPEIYLKKAHALLNPKKWIYCEKLLSKIDPAIIDSWLQSLAIERLEQKSSSILKQLKINSFDWEETFYIFLLKSFGFHLNNLPFEMLAKHTPLRILRKHKNDREQVEAVLFGQAGFLDQANIYDDYYNKLRREYLILKTKFNLKSIPVQLWKFSKSRPGNFPTVRLAQLAAILHNTDNLFSHVIKISDYKKLYKLFNCNTSEYWNTHFHFDQTSKYIEKNIGKSSINSIFINTIIPFIYLYGKLNQTSNYKEKALSLLKKIPAEQISNMKKWKSLNIMINNAMDTQALLQLKKNYCDRKKCLECMLGQNIIMNA